MRLVVVESAPRGGLLQYAAQLAGALAARGHDTTLLTAARGELSEAPPGVRLLDVVLVAARTPSEPLTGLAYLLRRAWIAAHVVAASLRTLLVAARGRYDAVLLVDDLSVAPSAAGALALTLLPRGPAVAAICHEPRPRSRRGDGDLYARSPVLLRLLGAFYSRADVIFVHGEASRDEFLEAWRAKDVSVIPHGDARLVAGDPPAPADGETILFFGEWRR